ncbi:MAG: fructose-6-phosphate aldolase [Nitrospirae bacterium]|nr:fructose-6-phosphate aldolase [Nitrospirota bacterium]MBI3594865.1 fructose-6-phosphate aldolase [Nitrospirota bacterium]
MKFFIDSANVAEIREANDLGVIDGVTTNPSLVSKEGRDLKGVIREICSIVNGPISAEVVALDAKEMVKEGLELVKIHSNVVVKIPMTSEGLKAIKILSKENIRVNTTLIFSPIQALMAAKAGAAYVSPFVGRLDDIGHVGMDLIQQIVTIFTNYAFNTEVLVASVRNPVHLIDAAMLGAHVATIPYSVIMQLTKHPLTDSGLNKFLSDWNKNPKKGS